MQREPFEQVVATHGAMVLRVCRGLLGTTDADDAWQETFLVAMRAWPELPEGSNVAGWLATIAHNKAIDQIRRAGRDARLVDRMAADPLEARTGPASDVDSGVEIEPGAQLHRWGAADGSAGTADHDGAGPPDERLLEALARLTDRQRAAVVHHHVAGLPYAEVARILGSSEAAARRSASDGIAHLRAAYRPATATATATTAATDADGVTTAVRGTGPETGPGDDQDRPATIRTERSRTDG